MYFSLRAVSVFPSSTLEAADQIRAQYSMENITIEINSIKSNVDP
jgi:hypothetical protein